MALALRIPEVRGLQKTLVTIGLGALDGWLLDSNVMAFLIKNAGVVAIDKLGLMKLPDYIVTESEGMLGLVAYALIKGMVK